MKQEREWPPLPTKSELLQLRDRAVARFVERFQLSGEIAQRGYETEIAIVDKAAMAKGWEESSLAVIGFLLEQGLINEAEADLVIKGKSGRWKMMPLNSNAYGMFLFLRDGRRRALVSNNTHTGIDLDATVGHEIAHSLSMESRGAQGGFIPFLIRWPEWKQEIIVFNEITTEVLRIAAKYPGVPTSKLLNMVCRGEISSVLEERVSALLALLEDAGSFTLEELAQAYFTNGDGRPIMQSLGWSDTE